MYHRDFNEKKDALKLLHKRALNRNPDEFYFHMVRSGMKDGEHIEKPKEDECTPEQLKLMQTQDLKYIAHKRHVEAKKIEKLQSELHLIDVEKSNTHTFFVDSKEDGNFPIIVKIIVRLNCVNFAMKFSSSPSKKF